MKSRLSPFYLMLFWAAAGLPLPFHATLGKYSRLIADDFCTAYTANHLGIFRATWYWYLTWTGRYAATLLDSLIGILGPQVTPFITSLTLLGWLAVLTWTVFSLLPPIEFQYEWATALATVLLSSTLLLSPNVPQSLYWGQGMRSVIPPLILGTLYVALYIVYQRRNWHPIAQVGWLAAAVVATFISGGFSETFTVAQILLLGGCVLWALFTRLERKQTPILFAALAGALVALVVVVIAPGNAVRQSTYPPAPGLFEILRISINGYGIFWGHLLGSIQNVAGLLGLVCFAFVFGIRLGPSPRAARMTLLFLIAGLLLTFACFPPAAYGTSDYPPERTQILPIYFLVIALTLCGVFLGRALSIRSERFILVLAVAALGLVAPVSFVSAMQLDRASSSYASYAQEWDQADAQIRAAHARGEKQVIVKNSPNWTHLNVLGNNPKFWVNICYSNYYDIQVFGDVPPDQ